MANGNSFVLIKFEIANGIVAKVTYNDGETENVVNINKTISKMDAPSYALSEFFNVDVYLNNEKITTQKILKGKEAVLHKGDGHPMSGIPPLRDETKEYKYFTDAAFTQEFAIDTLITSNISLYIKTVDKGGDGDVISPDVTTVEDFKKCVTDTLALKEFEISLNMGQYRVVETLSNIGGDNMYYSLTDIENGVNKMPILYRDGYLYLESEGVKVLTSRADVEKFIIGERGGFLYQSCFLMLALENLSDITFIKANEFTAKAANGNSFVLIKFEIANGIVAKVTYNDGGTDEGVININKTISKMDAPSYALSELFNVDVYLNNEKITTQKILKDKEASLHKGDGRPMSGIPRLSDKTKEYKYFTDAAFTQEFAIDTLITSNISLYIKTVDKPNN